MRTLLAVLFTLALAAPAAAVDPAIEDGSARTELNAAIERWFVYDVDDYRFRQSIGCFCPQTVTEPRTLRVRNGKPVRRRKYHKPYDTVIKLFGVIDQAIKDEVDELNVTYGKVGLPRSIYIDRSRMIADEELGLTNTRLRRLK